MNGQEFQNTLILVASSLQSGLPYVTGNLRRSVKAIAGQTGNVVLGTIVIEAPYAKYVNYGYEKHIGSVKLARDYKLVERITLNALLAKYQAKGAKVKWK